MSIPRDDAQKILGMLHQETGGKLIGRKTIVEQIITYLNKIPEDCRHYSIADLIKFLNDCRAYGTFKNW